MNKLPNYSMKEVVAFLLGAFSFSTANVVLILIGYKLFVCSVVPLSGCVALHMVPEPGEVGAISAIAKSVQELGLELVYMDGRVIPQVLRQISASNAKAMEDIVLAVAGTATNIVFGMYWLRKARAGSPQTPKSASKLVELVNEVMTWNINTPHLRVLIIEYMNGLGIHQDELRAEAKISAKTMSDFMDPMGRVRTNSQTLKKILHAFKTRAAKKL